MNDSLPNGGNVLGSMDARADNFMRKVFFYCVDHPDQRFYNAVSKTLSTVIAK
ncbi:MAG: hypothetical protein JEZ11_07895 [Desulfobacterales bacterium]|nr:hypothetical protein [Desulfobacterales bacterium]